MRTNNERLDLFAPSVWRASMKGNYSHRLSSERAFLAAAEWERSILHMCLYADRVLPPDIKELILKFRQPSRLDRNVAGTEGQLDRWRRRLLREKFRHFFLRRSQWQQDQERYMYYLGEWGGDDAHPIVPQSPELALHGAFFQPIYTEWTPFFEVLDNLAPLIESGVIEFYSPTRLYWDEVAKMMLGEVRSLTADELEHSWPGWFVAEGLCFASVLDVPYTATTLEEFEEIRRISTEVEQHLKLDQSIFAALVHLELPGFSADPSALASARLNDEGFQEFRETLRASFSHIRESIGTKMFQKEVARIETDLLQPELQRLIEEARGIRSLGRDMKEGTIDFSVGALTAFLATWDPRPALATGTLSAGARFLINRIAARTETSPASLFVQRITMRL